MLRMARSTAGLIVGRPSGRIHRLLRQEQIDAGQTSGRDDRRSRPWDHVKFSAGRVLQHLIQPRAHPAPWPADPCVLFAAASPLPGVPASACGRLRAIWPAANPAAPILRHTAWRPPCVGAAIVDRSRAAYKSNFPCRGSWIFRDCVRVAGCACGSVRMMPPGQFLRSLPIWP
jgi:hypothetical protein